MHQATYVTHVPWWMPGSLTSGFLWSLWWGKRSRHSRACTTRNFTYLVRGPCHYCGSLTGACANHHDVSKILLHTITAFSLKICYEMQFIYKWQEYTGYGIFISWQLDGNWCCLDHASVAMSVDCILLSCLQRLAWVNAKRNMEPP